MALRVDKSRAVCIGCHVLDQPTTLLAWEISGAAFRAPQCSVADLDHKSNVPSVHLSEWQQESAVCLTLHWWFEKEEDTDSALEAYKLSGKSEQMCKKGTLIQCDQFIIRMLSEDKEGSDQTQLEEGA